MLLECLKIFAARIIDVTLGTLRTVFFVKGKTIEPFIIAFFEVLIWYLIAKEALNTVGNTFYIAVSYAGGYATGTFIGSYLSKRLIKGEVGVQVILEEGYDKLINKLHKKGYGVSIIELKNDFDGKYKDMLFIEVSTKNLKELTNMIKAYDKDAFMVVNETKLVHNGFVK